LTKLEIYGNIYSQTKANAKKVKYIGEKEERIKKNAKE
jgi:hypothetical protein